MKFNVTSFLPLLPRNLTTFLFALTALLRFYGNTETLYFHLTLIQWSLVAFSLAAAFLVVNISLVEQRSCVSVERWKSKPKSRD